MARVRDHGFLQTVAVVAALGAGIVLIAVAWTVRPLGPFEDSSSEAANQAYSIVIAAVFYVVHLVFVLIVLCVVIASRGFGGAPLTALLGVFGAATIVFPILLISRHSEALGAVGAGLVLVSWLTLSAAIAAWLARRRPLPAMPGSAA
jgi:hypothetical protein